MKRLVCIILFMLMIGCGTIVNKVPKERRFTEAHSEIYTYIQMLPQGDGKFLFVPMTNSRYVNDRYEIMYEITYENGRQTTRWETVTETEYDAFEGGQNE